MPFAAPYSDDNVNMLVPSRAVLGKRYRGPDVKRHFVEAMAVGGTKLVRA